MDRLDRAAAAADPLLRRVDDLLTAAGAPADHQVWGELLRVRLLPAAAVRAVAALSPSAFREAVPELRADARACVDTAAVLPGPGEWAGDAAEAYEEARRRAAASLTGGDESLDERLEATADLADALTDWMARTRSELAATLATVLTSDEALILSVPAAEPAPTAAETAAAANVATHVLRTIADHYTEAMDLLHGSRELAAPVPM